MQVLWLTLKFFVKNVTDAILYYVFLLICRFLIFSFLINTICTFQSFLINYWLLCSALWPRCVGLGVAHCPIRHGWRGCGQHGLTVQSSASSLTMTRFVKDHPKKLWNFILKFIYFTKVPKIWETLPILLFTLLK